MTTKTYTVLDVWGFSDFLAVNVNGTDYLRAMNAEAVERGIDPSVPSDALDASRDVILMDAAARLKCNAEVIGTTLRLWPLDVTLDWAEVERVAGS